MIEGDEEQEVQPKQRSQRKPASQAKIRMEAMANSVDHKIAAAFTVILLLYAIITLGTWFRLEAESNNTPVIREVVALRSFSNTAQQQQLKKRPDDLLSKEKRINMLAKNKLALAPGHGPEVVEKIAEVAEKMIQVKPVAPRTERSVIKADEIPDIETLRHTFPVHAGHDMEVIDHPGVFMGTPEAIRDIRRKHPQVKATMEVPKFWRPIAYGPKGVREFLGEHGKRLITPEEASQIGSFTEDGLETIYISIASYRDPECQLTMEDMFERAEYPHRMRVAIIDQLAENDPVPPCNQPLEPCSVKPDQALCKYQHLIDRFYVPAVLSVGPVFARHLAHRMYRGEYYAMQLDSHVRFIEHWDSDLVSQWKSAKNEMAVITTYLSDLNGSIDPVTHENRHPHRPIMCETDYESEGKMRHLRHGQQPEGLPGIHGEPTLHPFWAAGFSFARGHFVVQVPYDQFQPMVFQGEEISIGLRGFTHGYDYYTAETSVAFHMYAIKENKEKRKKIKLFWENANLYPGSGLAGMKRLNGIIGMGDPEDEYYHGQEEEYGLGQVRTKEKFFKLYGIHPDTKTVEHNLCRFVGKPMMTMFKPLLRENGMGLDLDKTDFQWVNPDKDKETKTPAKKAVKEKQAKK